ncbi:MAG TPA: GNAT family N-acetyltransferase [Treponemataceae bacterium]|nr:GNAT family N-acetyltransferase [Treponemataceae bacterium]
MAVSIRTAVLSDIPYLYDICLKTGDNGKDASSSFTDPWLLGQFYAAPYLFSDVSLCFVAEENDIPLGYIIATANTLSFNTWMEKTWLPQIRIRYPLKESKNPDLSIHERNLISRIHINSLDISEEDLQLITEYPAHLHIDLLPELQGKGCGRALIQTLSTHLKSLGCPGLHLGVARANEGATAFYLKTGFSVLVESESSFTMGVKF